MRTRHSELTTDLFELVREAAHEGATQALAAHREVAPTPQTTLLDKRALAHALGVSTATIDRLVRAKRIPFIVVSQLRRFDLDAVRSALGVCQTEAASKHAVANEPAGLRGVRLLSRGAGG
jgi:hypothetical protein